ncbi:MAG TPA: hypothetical protein VK601_02215, partial [Kofleriaceae bacterium]|nr:hypothetical protein [Kofleriaceae bacterium]
MLHLCPTCRRQFPQPGFCPFDGASLVLDSSDLRTLISAQVPAQAPAQVPGAGPEERTRAEPQLGGSPQPDGRTRTAAQGS